MEKKIDLRPKRDLLKRPVATKIFTNREKMVNLFAEVLEKQEERGKLIYSFYGVGGIGSPLRRHDRFPLQETVIRSRNVNNKKCTKNNR